MPPYCIFFSMMYSSPFDDIVFRIAQILQNDLGLVKGHAVFQGVPHRAPLLHQVDQRLDTGRKARRS